MKQFPSHEENPFIRSSVEGHIVTLPPSTTYKPNNKLKSTRLTDDADSLVEQKPKRTTSATYLPALDGLRAFAVLAVVLYHMRTMWAPCGLMGVTIFFVLSGYLITSLLAEEWNTTHRISLKNFWLKRVRRLVPAIVFLLLCLLVLCAMFSPVMLTKLKQDLLSCLFFFNNWWQIFHDVSYFENMGSPSPVTHFWSLAIEEQFYIVWPLLLLLLFKLRSGKNTIRWVIVALCLLSALDMALLYNPSGDPSRVYYGTDTRAFSLLIGAWLAFTLPASRIRSPRFTRPMAIGFEIGAFLSLAVIAVMIFTVSAYEPFLYQGGYFLISVLTAIIIVALVNNKGVLSKVFALAPFVWVGKRSYGLYLWHYPLLLLMNPPTDFAEKPWWAYLIQVAVILAVTEFSYHFVEMPVRQGVIGKTISAITVQRAPVSSLLRRHSAYFGTAGALCVVALIAAVVVPPTMAAGNAAVYRENDVVDPGQAMAAQNGDERNAAADGDLQSDGTSQPGRPPQSDGQSAQPSADDPSKGETTQSDDASLRIPRWPQEGFADTQAFLASLPEDPREWEILLVGDSVSRMAKDEFESRFSKSHEDSVSNRTIEEGKTALQAWLDEGWKGDAVILSLGANVVDTPDGFRLQYESLVNMVPDGVPVFVMNIRTPGIDNYPNNGIIERIARERDDVYLVDWYNLTTEHSSWFESDGTHLNEEGAAGFVSLLEEVLRGYRDEALQAQRALQSPPSETPSDTP